MENIKHGLAFGDRKGIFWWHDEKRLAKHRDSERWRQDRFIGTRRKKMNIRGLQTVIKMCRYRANADEASK